MQMVLILIGALAFLAFLVNGIWPWVDMRTIAPSLRWIDGKEYWMVFWTAAMTIGTLTLAWMAYIPLAERRRERNGKCKGALQILISRTGILSIKNIDDYAVQVVSVHQERFLAAGDVQYWAGHGETVDDAIDRASTVAGLLNRGGDFLKAGKAVSRLSDEYSYTISPHELVVILGSRTHYKVPAEESVALVKTVVEYQTLGPGDSKKKWKKTVVHSLVGSRIEPSSSIEPRNKWVRTESLIQ